MIESYPLHWPAGVKRSFTRERARFKVSSFGHVRDELIRELKLLGAKEVILSTNIPLRNDGLPYASYKEPVDAGVAVYFNLYGKQNSIACDRWSNVLANLRAVQLTIEALRGIERWGGSEIVKATFTGFAAITGDVAKPAKDYFQGVETREEAKERYVRLARQLHPDSGGTDAEMQELNAQYTKYIQELK